MKKINILDKNYFVKNSEFNIIKTPEYSNLKIIDKLGKFERIISFLTELSKCIEIENLLINHVCHGGFIPINCSNQYKNVFIIKDDYQLKILENINNIHLISTINDISLNNYTLLNLNNNEIIVNNNNKDEYINYVFDKINVKIPIILNKKFIENFNYYLNDNILNYDNLNNMCIMVKNGGPQFEKMLLDNMEHFDRWTILDTGSTDETIQIINKVLVGKKKGNLYQEPFINFRDSRNRLLDLAGTHCKFNTMLDDTYVIHGDLRNFLNEVRGDIYSDSFTIFIQSNDTSYGSNRIIKSLSGLRYIHKIHEVITDKNNINVVIPYHISKIEDRTFDYMNKRTMERKQLDLKLLYEEVDDNPEEPRSYYYLAQTYSLLEDYDNAFYYFNKRCEYINSGFLQERYDAAFEAARIANFKINKPWDECYKLYKRAFKIDESRPEAMYFIGIHYYLENDFKRAYKYLKKGFEIGYPEHCQYSLKPTLSFHFLPKFLTRCCYHVEDYILGEKSSEFFLLNNKEDAEDYQEILSWYQIYKKLNIYDFNNYSSKVAYKKLFVFVADGNFNKWSGSTILTSGVGGSETYIIEMARYIQKTNKYQVIVFCNCEKNEIFEDVIYKHLNEFPAIVNEYNVDTCIISRYSEYLPLAIKGRTENVYLVVHDLTPSGIVIPLDPKLKKIFCLTEWHVSYMSKNFPGLKHLLEPFYYGIDVDRFLNKHIQKIPYKFIYSSFPNRGLLPLLQMWPLIFYKEPKSSLYIYSDVNGKWVNEVAKEEMDNIKILLKRYKNMNIFYYGWVDKNTLYESWLSSEFWFYPCIFMETFCLTALEAAISKTFVITNGLSGLENTVNDRGLIIKGNPLDKQWQEKAIEKLFYYMDNKNDRLPFIEKNYNWACNLSWEKQANNLLNLYISPKDDILNNIQHSKKLIYFTIFKNIKYVEMLKLLLKTIENNIDENTTLLFYTSSEFKNIIEIFLEKQTLKCFNYYFMINDSINTVLECCCARYQIFNLPNINNYDTILYLDSDILIYNHLNRVFNLCKDNKIYVIAENCETPCNYWGDVLFENEILKKKHGRSGYNSGVMLFKNFKSIKNIFNDIYKHAYNSKLLLPCFDQPYFNYHIVINNVVNDYDLINYVRLISNNDSYIDCNKYSILHFYSNVDNKLQIMNEFFIKNKPREL